MPWRRSSNSTFFDVDDRPNDHSQPRNLDYKWVEGAMTTVNVREFSHNPSGIFARVEAGEMIEVTKHGRVVAVLVPPPRGQSRYDELVAQGVICPPRED